MTAYREPPPRPTVPAEWIVDAAREALPDLKRDLKECTSEAERRTIQCDINACKALIRDGVPSWEEMDASNAYRLSKRQAASA